MILRRFRAEDFETVRDAADAFLETVSDSPKRGCFAAAGPVIEGRVDFTNSPWTLCARDIVGPLKLDQLKIVNDFYALAAGVAYLPEDAFIDVKPGEPLGDAPQLVIGPGTGFGQALIVPTGAGRKIIATEGGHVSFAAQSDEEQNVKNFLAREHSRVSVERLLSGGGLVDIYRALCRNSSDTKPTIRASDISNTAREGTDPLADKAVDIFCAVLGGVAGDAVLSTGARGGVVLGGGMLPKMHDLLKKSVFIERYSAKGRMSDYVGAVPVKLITADYAALYGAAALIEAD